MDAQKIIEQAVDGRYRDELVDLSRQIWELAEVGYEEKQSAETLCQALERHGFTVTRNLNGIVYRINLKTREHQLLQQINAVGRGLLLAFGRIDNFPVYFASLCRSSYRDVVESKGFFC